jgi:pseudaminic acid cytidylyltransferase
VNAAVIPARGGSVRIPRKNVKEFAGKPMIAHSIECAIVSGLFERIVVSTDDAEISSIAREAGVEAPFVRPKELSDDHTGTAAVVAHSRKWLRGDGVRPDAVCCIYATAPFIRADDVSAGLELLETGGWDYVFSATDYGYPVFRSFVEKAGGGLEMVFPEKFNSRSQDLPEALHDAGQFYWGRPLAWLAGGPIFGAKSAVVRIPRWRVQDIDTPDDWQQAELIWRIARQAEEGK